MELLRLPPKIKILEALSAVYGDRVKVVNDKFCRVTSSDGTRVYNVFLDLEQRLAYSDDNGTRYRRYIGYPIISFLIVKGVVPADNEIGEIIRGVKWKQLNEKYKKYDIVMNEIYKILIMYGIDRKRVEKYIENVMNILRGLKLKYIESLPSQPF